MTGTLVLIATIAITSLMAISALVAAYLLQRAVVHTTSAPRGRQAMASLLDAHQALYLSDAAPVRRAT